MCLRVTQKVLQLPLFSSFFSFTTANLDGLTKAACWIFYVCYARRVWLNSDTLEKGYVSNNNCHEFSKQFGISNRFEFTHINVPQSRGVTESYNCFTKWKCILIHGNQHSQPKGHKTQKLRKKMKSDRRFKAAQDSNRPKDRGIELINKEVWRKRKGKVFSRRNDSYIIWQWSSTVAKELDSSELQNITTGYIGHKIAILLDDIAVDGGWSIPATFL